MYLENFAHVVGQFVTFRNLMNHWGLIESEPTSGSTGSDCFLAFPIQVAFVAGEADADEPFSMHSPGNVFQDLNTP
jgi:hypothetical protein